jgi:hypothetical protein
MDRLKETLTALTTMSPAQLKAEWRRVFNDPPPQAFGADLIARAIAHRLQQKATGIRPSIIERKVARVMRQLDGAAATAPSKLRPGARLAREWRGDTHHVVVTDEGFLYRQRSYPSLTAIAREITGAAWSGPRFFGLRRTARETSNGAA